MGIIKTGDSSDGVWWESDSHIIMLTIPDEGDLTLSLLLLLELDAPNGRVSTRADACGIATFLRGSNNIQI